ncbi:leucine--tRNA ligase [Buchnera aphidicola]|uniref:Leucine--tRNA ligase n=1 Tax=Buchnera aphidicola (Sarucallis kahawaluokalani) TaxID=1241878 RepID=A0A4D6Y8T2_9GAMM|nr:leucine--tRNA ligase [Buchnera aphidicola]QCI26077.1 leucine--tRNA ligase [Buchnera aphidicola (Sarucallis kahawaluokalani)]
MKKIYQPKILEPIVQKHWDQNKTFQVTEKINQKKYYCLSMLPYPSGKLHMGHVRNYTISDVIARYQRMLGKNVLHPMGWDAFGLPAEEAAIRNNTIPSQWTFNNIKYMKNQLKKLGFSYDWTREINTCDSKYYHWEQWFFKKLYSLNLVYKKTALINWCKRDKTVLANEQVINGTCWRCQTKITQKVIPQWFIKITEYAETLLQDLKLLKKWPKKIIKMQKNWIGQYSGFKIILNLYNSKKKITTYTTRLDLFFGVTYIAISPLHKLIKKELTSYERKKIIQNNYTLHNNKDKIKYIGKQTSRYAVHPITKKKIPIWITNYVNIEYNINSKICCPAHNRYDWEFAKKYNIKKKYVIFTRKTKKSINTSNPIEELGNLYNSYEFNGLSSPIATKKIFNILKQTIIIENIYIYRLQDWSISRQRYWGTPIPVAYNNKKITLIPDNKLPVLLPPIKTINDLQNINIIYKEWSKTNINDTFAKKETDTFDTFIESSWYHIRYTDPNYPGMINKKAANYWLPVDQYIGGIEHATMHLIYFRFFHKVLYQLKMVNSPEPAKKLLCQGMVLSDTFYYINPKGQKEWIHPKNIIIKKNKLGKIKKIITKDKKEIQYAGMMKMSKSKNNGIDPEEMIKKYGSDTIRLFIMFAAPVQSDIEWNESGVKGMYRFLQKIWNMVYKYINNIYQKQIKKTCIIAEILSIVHKTILKVSEDIHHRQSFNTAISEIMKFTNYINTVFNKTDIKKKEMKNILNTIIKMLHPFTPHITFTLWKILNNNTNIDNESWPKYNKNLIINNNVKFIIQINGKKKDILTIPYDTTQYTILKIIKKDSKISKIIKNQLIKKTIFISNKLINLVI